MNTQPLEIFAWVAADITGNVGIMTVVTPLGMAPAAFQNIEHANLDWIRDQVQERADELGITVNLLHLRGDAQVVRNIKPTAKSN